MDWSRHLPIPLTFPARRPAQTRAQCSGLRFSDVCVYVIHRMGSVSLCPRAVTGLRIPQYTSHVGWKASCPIRRAIWRVAYVRVCVVYRRKAFCSCLKNMTSSIIRVPPPSGCSRCSCPSCTFCHPTNSNKTRPDVENPIGRWDDAHVA